MRWGETRIHSPLSGFRRRCGSFWIIGVVTVTLATLFRPLALGHELLIPDNFTSAVFVVAFVVLAASKHRRLHEVVAPVIFALLVFDVVGWNFAMAE